LEGTGNTALLGHPELKLPAGLKQYNAEKNQESETCTVFEYVVQATEPGVMTIPSQEFIFFDIQSHEYRTIKTLSSRIHVKQSEIVQQSQQAEQENFEHKKTEPDHTSLNNVVQESPTKYMRSF